VKYFYTAIFSFFFLLIAPQAFAFTGEGSGVVDDRYIITTCEQLQEINSYTEDYYVLQNDIDCTGTTSWNEGAGFVPITNFYGNFDGRNRTINGLFMDRTGDSNGSGLFARTNGAVVKNVKLTNADITLTSGSYAGMLIGRATDSEISGVSVSGDLVATGSIGGLVAYLEGGSISRCSASGTVTASSAYTGGLFSIIAEASVSDCYGDIDVVGPNTGGGFAARVWVNGGGDTSISRSYYSGTANISNYRAAFVGWVHAYDTGTTTFSDLLSAATYDTNTLQNFYTNTPSSPGTPVIINSVYDSSKGSGDAITSCAQYGVHPDCANADSDTLINNTTSAPFRDGEVQKWDFDTVWLVQSDRLPILRDATLEDVTGFTDNIAVEESSGGGLGFIQPPICEVSFYPDTVTLGEQTTLSWSVAWPGDKKNTHYVRVPREGLFSSRVSSVSVLPQHTTTYRLATFNLWGANFCEAQITVLDENGEELTSNQNSYLTAGVSNSPIVRAITNFFRSIFSR
jgi:hypothetical protein